MIHVLVVFSLSSICILFKGLGHSILGDFGTCSIRGDSTIYATFCNTGKGDSFLWTMAPVKDHQVMDHNSKPMFSSLFQRSIFASTSTTTTTTATSILYIRSLVGILFCSLQNSLQWRGGVSVMLWKQYWPVEAMESSAAMFILSLLGWQTRILSMWPPLRNTRSKDTRYVCLVTYFYEYKKFFILWNLVCFALAWKDKFLQFYCLQKSFVRHKNLPRCHLCHMHFISKSSWEACIYLMCMPLNSAFPTLIKNPLLSMVQILVQLI